MNQADQFKMMALEMEDLSSRLSASEAEVGRLREQVRVLGEENGRLRRENASLRNTSAPAEPAPVAAPTAQDVEYERLARELERTKAALAKPAPAEPVVEVSAEVVAARKRRLTEEIQRARETIQQAAMIRQQMAELERITNTLAQENERLRRGPDEPAEAPAPASGVRSMIRPLSPPPPKTTVEVVQAAEAAKLSVKPPVVQPATTTAAELSGRRTVFLNSIFSGKKPG